MRPKYIARLKHEIEIAQTELMAALESIEANPADADMHARYAKRHLDCFDSQYCQYTQWPEGRRTTDDVGNYITV